MKLTLTGITFDLTLEPEPTPPRLLWSVTVNGVTTTDVHMLILPDDKQSTLSIQPVDAKGHPAKVDGVPAWSVANPSVAVIQPIPDDGSGIFKATLAAGTDLGDTQVNVTADADLGEGTTTITGLLDVSVVAGTAVGLQVSAAAPEDLKTPQPV